MKKEQWALAENQAFIILEPEYTYNIKSRKLFEIKGGLPINAPAKRLWETITTPGHLELFHPFVKEHRKSDDWKGIGGRDSGVFHNGGERHREIVEWDEGNSYRIKMDNNDGHDTQVRFAIKRISKNKAGFSISISKNSFRKIPRLLWPVLARWRILPLHKKYLFSVLNGLAYYSETGKKVKKNQFGRHSRLSP